MANRLFDGKVALVTGASSGIGRATALAFVNEGARVILADVREDEGLGLRRQIEKQGGSAVFSRCDVSQEVDVKRMLDDGLKAFGRLDYAFNNAGIEGIPGATCDCTDENWERTIDINLKGVWLCMKNEIPEMCKQGKGVIVNCSSVAGLIGLPNIPAYVASKHGVIGLTKTAALEMAQSGIRVNAVCPGVIQTPMIDRFTHQDPKAYRELLQNEPMRRAGTPQEVADAVLWLCSDKATFVTGHPLVVDGGWVAA